MVVVVVLVLVVTMVIVEESILLVMRKWALERRNRLGNGLVSLLREHPFTLPSLLAGVFAFLCRPVGIIRHWRSILIEVIALALQ